MEDLKSNKNINEQPIDSENSKNSENITLEEKLQNTREYWTKVIHELNEHMKDLGGLQNLLNRVYSKRQDCVEYLSNLRVVLGKLKLAHKSQYAKLYANYKLNGQLRFSSDSSLNTQIESDLYDINEKINFIATHTEAMIETLKTIDNMIYGISQRIKIYELTNNIKF